MTSGKFCRCPSAPSHAETGVTTDMSSRSLMSSGSQTIKRACGWHVGFRCADGVTALTVRTTLPTAGWPALGRINGRQSKGIATVRKKAEAQRSSSGRALRAMRDNPTHVAGTAAYGELAACPPCSTSRGGRWVTQSSSRRRLNTGSFDRPGSNWGPFSNISGQPSGSGPKRRAMLASYICNPRKSATPSPRLPRRSPDEQLEFTPDLCEDILLIDSPRPLILPIGMYELALPCASCGEDLLQGLPRETAPAEEGVEPDPYTSLAASGYQLAPTRCSACGQPLKHSELALSSLDERIDEVPFFCFCLALLAARPPSEPLTAVDPELLLALRAICGVPFRSTPREI